MAEIPEHILRRSAEARARATGRPVEEILAEMKGEATPVEQEPAAGESAPPPAPETPPSAPAEPGGTAGIPEALLKRTAEARAKREGRPVEEVLAELKGEAPAPAAPAPAPAQPTAASGGAGIPEALLKRTAEARAKREGRPVEEVLAELKGEAPAPAAPAPAPGPAPATPAPPAPAAASGSARDLQAESSEYGVPAELLERAMRARARHDGTPLPTTGAPVPAATPAAAAAAAPAAAAAAPAPAAPAVPEGVRTQRLLTVVKAGAIQQVKSEPHDKVNVWPHLLAIEFVALLVVLGALIVFSVFVDAPLLEFANFNEQPNPSKAPWYFLGLQELLSYFDPQVAGVIIPGFGLGGLAIIPYIDRNPSVRPSDRKLAIMIFTVFVMSSAILTIFGSFFRGPGFNFTFPWVDGIFFDF